MLDRIDLSQSNTEMILVFSVASKHCVPILADEIYSDMVRTTNQQSTKYRLAGGLGPL